MTSSSSTNWTCGSKPATDGKSPLARFRLIGVLMLGPEHVGEPQDGHDDVRVVVGEVADVGLDFGQGAFEPGPGRSGARRVLARTKVGSFGPAP